MDTWSVESREDAGKRRAKMMILTGFRMVSNFRATKDTESAGSSGGGQIELAEKTLPGRVGVNDEQG